MERLSGIIKVGPKCNHKYPYKRQAEGDFTAGRREDPVMETERSQIKTCAFKHDGNDPESGM